MISVTVPLGLDKNLDRLLQAIIQRALDVTTVPIFVDYTNQRVIIGATAASAAPAKFEISGGDLKIVTSGSGVIISNRAGTQYYRLIMNNNGSIAADPL